MRHQTRKSNSNGNSNGIPNNPMEPVTSVGPEPDIVDSTDQYGAIGTGMKVCLSVVVKGPYHDYMKEDQILYGTLYKKLHCVTLV